ncbi:MAG: tetratricopeptide repeat protein [Bacteroidetes bacterium]|nr:tetratricopeptide repeat protein [Bacteroidota bacterium]
MINFLKNNLYFHLALIAGVTFFIFYPSIFYELTNWDAPDLIEQNILIRSLSIDNLKKMFGGFYWYNYQPLTLLSLAVEYNFFGINPEIIHLDNIILHCLNALLCYWFVFLLTGQKPVAFITAILWAIHPLRVESVTWVVERKDVLYSFFFLLALIQYLRYLQSHVHPESGINVGKVSNGKRRIYYSFALLFFILACFAKGMAVSLTLILPFLDFFIRRKFSFAAVIDKIPFTVISLIFGITVIFAVRSNTLEPIVTIHPLHERLLFASYAPFFYCGKFLYPLNLSALYSYKYVPGNLPDFYIVFPILLFIAGILILFSFRFTRKLIFGFGFFFSALFLVLPFHQTNVAPVADHYTYMGNIGLCLIAGWSVWFLLSLRTFTSRHLYRIFHTAIIILIAATIGMLGYLTRQHIPVWKNSISLWKNVLKRNISKSAFLNLGNAYQRLGKYKEALKYNEAAIHVSPTSFLAHNNRGYIRQRLFDFRGAESDFRKSLAINPTCVKAYNNLGTVMFATRQYDSAMVSFNKAIELSPDFNLAYFNRGNLLAHNGKYALALADFNRAVQLNPYMPQYHIAVGNIQIGMNEFKAALETYNKVLMLDTSQTEVIFRRGLIKLTLKDTVSACEDFYIALKRGFSPAAMKADQFCTKYSEKFTHALKDQPLHFRKILYPDGRVKLEFSDELIENPDSIWRFVIIKKLKHYDSKGNLIEEGVVDSTGKFDGAINWFYPDGKLSIAGFYKDTLPYGHWKEYYRDGTLMAEYSYANGKRNGVYTFYHPNGAVWTKRLYNNGKLWEVISNFTRDGVPLDPGILKNGTGTVKVYDEKGKLVSVLVYRDGKTAKKS